MNDKTKVDLLLNKLKNNSLTSWVIVISAILLAMISLAEGLKKAGDLFGSTFAESQQSVSFHADTLSKLLDISKRMDLLFLKLKAENGAVDYSKYQSSYLEIQAGLNNLSLRNEVYEFNQVSLENMRIMASNWEHLGKIIERSKADGSPAYFEGKSRVIESAESAINQGLKAVLKFEYENTK